MEQKLAHNPEVALLFKNEKLHSGALNGSDSRNRYCR